MKNLKRLEQEEFNNIIGADALRRRKLRRNEGSSQTGSKTAVGQSTVYERYDFGNLQALLVGEHEATGNGENAEKAKVTYKVRETSEPDNDRFHQLYDENN